MPGSDHYPRRRHNRGGITLSLPIRLSLPIQLDVPAVSLSLTLGAIHGCRVKRKEGSRLIRLAFLRLPTLSLLYSWLG